MGRSAAEQKNGLAGISAIVILVITKSLVDLIGSVHVMPLHCHAQLLVLSVRRENHSDQSRRTIGRTYGTNGHDHMIPAHAISPSNPHL